MRKVFIALALIGSLFFISAAPASAVVPSYSYKEKAYAKYVKANDYNSKYVSNGTIIRLGRAICKSLRAGVSVGAIVNAGINSGMPTRTIAVTLVGAGGYLCKDQMYKIRAYANSVDYYA